VLVRTIDLERLKQKVQEWAREYYEQKKAN